MGKNAIFQRVKVFAFVDEVSLLDKEA